MLGTRRTLHGARGKTVRLASWRRWLWAGLCRLTRVCPTDKRRRPSRPEAQCGPEQRGMGRDRRACRDNGKFGVAGGSHVKRGCCREHPGLHPVASRRLGPGGAGAWVTWRKTSRSFAQEVPWARLGAALSHSSPTTTRAAGSTPAQATLSARSLPADPARGPAEPDRAVVRVLASFLPLKSRKSTGGGREEGR